MHFNYRKFIPKRVETRWIILIILCFIPLGFKIFWLSILLIFIGSLFFIADFYKSKDNKRKVDILYFFFCTSVAIIFFYSYIYRQLGIIPPSGENVVRPSDYIYFSIVTWTTLGYGDFRPSPESRLYAASQAFLGYLYMAIFIGKLFQLFSTINNDTIKANKDK